MGWDCKITWGERDERREVEAGRWGPQIVLDGQSANMAHMAHIVHMAPMAPMAHMAHTVNMSNMAYISHMANMANMANMASGEYWSSPQITSGGRWAHTAAAVDGQWHAPPQDECPPDRHTVLTQFASKCRLGPLVE